MVISYKIGENLMGYRGSKSILSLPAACKTNIVKEQRVDGSWFINIFKNIAMNLRYTLMGCESGFHIKILSNQLNKLLFSTLNFKSSKALTSTTSVGARARKPIKLNPWFITGFADAESNFTCSIVSDSRSKLNWEVSMSFNISLHIKDIQLLEDIKYTLGVGKIRKHTTRNIVHFVVENKEELITIIDHFEKYPLVTSKKSEYLIFKKCLNIFINKEHLLKKGLFKLVALKSSLNKGLSEKLKIAFPDIVAFNKPDYYFTTIPDPFWIAGFTSGDGSFVINLNNSKNNFKLASLEYTFHLNVKDADVLRGLIEFFNLKIKVVILNNINSAYIHIRKFEVIYKIIIPFFENYPVQGLKFLDFLDFKKAAKFIKNKNHLTLEGYSEILKIKSNMNQNRKW
jgi:competence protein ComGF